MNRLYRLASRRQFIDNRDVQITIQSHGKRTGDRRGSHYQHMRRTRVFLPKLGTLGDTKPMLFVNHHQSERREIYGIFDNGMRADEYLHFARHQITQDCFPLLAFHISCQQFYTDRHPGKETGNGLIMLVGKDFGRRHHTRLIAVV